MEHNWNTNAAWEKGSIIMKQMLTQFGQWSVSGTKHGYLLQI